MMDADPFTLFFSYVDSQHSRSLEAIKQAEAIDPERFHAIAGQSLRWLYTARGEQGFYDAIDAYVQFSTEVVMAQLQYERDGHYAHRSYQDCYDNLYSQRERMDSYLWGVFLTNFAWAHHFEISLFYLDRFLARLTDSKQLYELAPGHGGWGVWALSQLPQAQLTGIDISPSSLVITQAIAKAAGVMVRSEYREKNVLELQQEPTPNADACICNFLIEHLETPEKLLATMHHIVKPNGLAFLSGAITAAQIDHIYEFKHESELVVLAEQHGFRVLETFSGNPRKTLPNAQFIPRSMALILQKHKTL